MTISIEKAKTILDKTLDITMIELSDEQKNDLVTQLSQQSVSAKTRDEKIEEVAALIEIIENYVEKEDINVDNSERIEAVLYEGIPADETSAFYGSWYFAIEVERKIPCRLHSLMISVILSPLHYNLTNTSITTAWSSSPLNLTGVSIPS